MKVLVATDGSDGSLKAAVFATKLMAADKALEIHLIGVKDTTTGMVSEAGVGVMIPLGEGFMQALETSTARALDETEKALKDAGATAASKRSEWGSPAARICAVAQEIGADMVVVGSRGMGGLTGLLLGSVSDRIVHRCHAPVLVVR